MRKIVSPSLCDVWKGQGKARSYAKIEYKDGRLSISGVIGPMSNGNCRGSAGQCIDEIREGEPANGWTKEMLERFCEIWELWHLNDARPYCSHQKALGWGELAGKEVLIYHYRHTEEARRKKKLAEEAALDALRNGRTFTPTEEQIMFATLPYSYESHEELTGDMAKYYEPKKPLYPGDKGPTETKILGFLYPSEHPEGLLTRPCPECGYKYGTSHIKEEVPEEVIEFLFSLPECEAKPAWV